VRRCPTAHVALLSFGCLIAAFGASAQPATIDAQFREAFVRQYEQLTGVKPDMLVEELRLRIELVASRGSRVGAASDEKRLRGFESLLLQTLQTAICPGGNASADRPSRAVIESVTQAAKGQRLVTEGSDVAELAAITQRLIESTKGLCALASLDEVE
jgi:hypothetical protein